ncbi:MAG: AI-2E family transporter [Planctomycetota bacterium]|nr:MAG: AI-2E family transporter [Planctomycetota bacterium]
MTPPQLDPSQPREFLQRWLPHALLLGLAGASLLLVLMLLAPLRDPIFLAISLAALTGPLLFEPWDRLLRRSFPSMRQLLRQQISGILATLSLVVIIFAPIFAMILSTVGGIGQAIEVIIGIALRDGERMAALFQAFERQLHSISRLYPGLPIDANAMRGWLEEALTEASDLGPTFLSFLFRGTGSLLVHLALALIILPNCYAQGALAARFILGYTPLNDEQMAAVARRHRSVVTRLLSDTIAFALLRGILLGGLAWFFIGLPLVPVIVFATFLALVPAVGTTMVWLPLVLILWTSGQIGAAMIMAGASFAGSLALSWIRAHVGLRLDEASGIWLSFLLFLGLAGGLMTFGAKGFVIGPMIMVLAILVVAHFLPYYGMNGMEDAPDEDEKGPESGKVPDKASLLRGND